MNGWLIFCMLLGSDPAPITIDSALLTVADQAEVPARDSGVLIELRAREGQVVKSGELLARLDDAEVRIAKGKAVLDLKRAQKLAASDVKVRLAKIEHQYSIGELSRAEEAAKKLANSVSNAEFDRLRSNVNRAALELEQSQLEQETAQFAIRLLENELLAVDEKMRRRAVLSPLDGVVVVMPKRLGEWVEAGQTVVRVVSVDKLRVEFFLIAEQARPGLVGKAVRFTPRGSAEGTTPVLGRVSVVNPEVDPVNGQARVWAEIDNREGHLRPGLTGSLTIMP